MTKQSTQNHPERDNVAQSLLCQVKATIDRYHMITAGQRVLAAVSGGPDSVALAYILKQLAPHYGFELIMAHLNHMLRPGDAQRDAEFTARLADRLGIPLINRCIDVAAYRKRMRLSTEDAARRVRLRFLSRAAQAHGCACIALGHHADDNAELVLMRLLRGSGAQGLSAMAPVRKVPDTAASIIRPLFSLQKSVILNYLRHRQLDYCIDHTNLDTQYTRNQIRLRLIPQLAHEYNPKIVGTLCRGAEIISADDDLLNQLAWECFISCQLFQSRSQIVIDRTRLAGRHIALQRRVIRCALKALSGHLHAVTAGHIESIINRDHQNRSIQIRLPGQISVEIDDSRIRFRRHRGKGRIKSDRCADIASFHYDLRLPQTLFVPELGLFFHARCVTPPTRPKFDGPVRFTAWIDADRVQLPLSVQSIPAGARFHPLGAPGRQKVSRFFRNSHVDPADRRHACVVVDRSRIVWLVGHRLSDHAQITQSTRRAIEIQVLLA